MNKEELENYIKEHSTREAARYFECSQTNIRYWLKKFNIKINKETVYIEDKKTCPKCKQIKPLSEFTKAKDKKSVSWCKACMTRITIEKQRECKRKMIDYKGGECQACGFNNYSGALEFHHLDPKTKDNGLSRMQTKTMNKRIIEELNKCILLCSNCHRMIHAGIITIDEQGHIMINKDKFDNIE